MATTYNWNCKTVDCYPTDGQYTDVVYNVHWIVTGTSDTLDPEGNAYTATSIGTETISTSDLSPVSVTLTIGEPVPPAEEE